MAEDKAVLGLLGIGIVGLGVAGLSVGLYFWLRKEQPEPLYKVGQVIYIDGEREIVRDIEWREETRWLEGGDGRVYPPQWWYYTGYGELPNWWPESIITWAA
ncbi:hypothetical protein ES703_124338 [subsurface metagenome]